MLSRSCKGCGIAKPNSEFYIDRRAKSGLRSKCKDCEHELRQLRRLNVIERVRRSKGEGTEALCIDNQTVSFHAWSKRKQFEVLVDRADWEQLNLGESCWVLDTNGYAFRLKNAKAEYLHHLILPGIPKGTVRDHVNRNRLDNRRCNLRAVSCSINVLNRGQEATTGIRIRSLKDGSKRFTAMLAGRSVGTFCTLVDAINVRNGAGLIRFGPDFPMNPLPHDAALGEAA